MNKKVKNLLSFLIIVLVTLLVLYFSLKDDYDIIVNEILKMNKIWILVSFLLLLSYWFFKAIVIDKLASKFNKKYSIRNAFRMVIETNFFHAVTPFATGGQPYEIYSLKKNNLKITDATNVSIQNFIVYQIALVTLGVIAIIYNYFFKLFPSNSVLKNLVTLGFVINLLVIIFLFILTFTKKINKIIIKLIINILYALKIVKNKEDKEKSINQYLNEFHIGAKLLLKNKFEFISMIFMHLISLISLYLIPLTLLYATGDYISFTSIQAIVTSSYVMLIGSFVPIPGGTGGLEYGFVVFYGNFISKSLVRAIMLIWRFITYYAGMIIGAIVLSTGKKE